ncbi:MAG: CDP-diacylglycerol--glycerol-3-phosphate 3-phosphatidyltransferase [Micrococcales bacterium]|nr:CDP-diacylglycerol--glycerol-3-phosphate 3-phosphatidyltransferase [Micrococcales bacterium]
MTADRAVWTLPNLLTALRVLLVPVFAVLLVTGADDVPTRLVALGLFVAAAATDQLDGWLARRWDQVTDLGKLLDPIADKLLMVTALVLLSVLGELPWWVTVVIVVRELGITVMRFFLLRYVVLPASRGGKVKTVLQSVAIGLFLLPLQHLPEAIGWFAWTVMAAALVVTVVTGLDYVRAAWRIREEA